jgi:signal transduction histidine kinase
MNAETLVQNLSDAIFVVIFVAVARKAIERPSRTNIDVTLFFGAIASIVAESLVLKATDQPTNGVLNVVVETFLMALPYLLMRLLDDFGGVPRLVMRVTELGLGLSVVAIGVWASSTLPLPIVIVLVLYFALASGYFVSRIRWTSSLTGSVSRWRSRAIGVGAAGLGLIIVLAGVSDALPASSRWAINAASAVGALLCGIAFYIGFAPPSWLRRAWQEPELRAFLGRAASLPRMPNTRQIVRELESGVTASLGTGTALIGLWDQSTGELQFQSGSPPEVVAIASAFARRAFETQQTAFVTDARKANPNDAELYEQQAINSVLSVPITAGKARLGILVVCARRAPLFAEDDITLTELLADQAAVILESRALIDEAARMQAREEVVRLKDDFLSAAAHDLKTPLTALIAQAQLLERRAQRFPDRPVDVGGVQRLVGDAQRLRRLVTELLDVSRVEEGKLIGKRQDVDLVAIASAVCRRYSTDRHPCVLEGEGHVFGRFDEVRIGQLLDNLVENAVKYSPENGEVRVRVWLEEQTAMMTVTDQGIGIPERDLAHLFDRFHRGSNVDDRRFAGMGLGLFICKGIVEQHGGAIWATSSGQGFGSTFHIRLPDAGRPERAHLEEPLPAQAAQAIESAPSLGEAGA